MKIAIKTILEAHKARTGEVIYQDALAREMVKEGLFSSFESARNMIQYNSSGEAKSADYALVEFLMRRFEIKSMDQIIEY